MNTIGKLFFYLLLVILTGSLIFLLLGFAADALGHRALYSGFGNTIFFLALVFSIFVFFKIAKKLYKKIFAKEIEEADRVLKDISIRGFDDWRLYVGGGSHMCFNFKARKFILWHGDNSLETYDFSSVAGVRFDAQKGGIRQIIISLKSLERPAIRIKMERIKDIEDTFEKLRVIFFDGDGVGETDSVNS